MIIIQEMKGSLDNVNNTLEEMKDTIGSLFLINAMKESSYQYDVKNSIDNLISKRCNQILKELIENDKKNNNKNQKSFNGTNSNVSINQKIKNKNKNRFSFTKKTKKARRKTIYRKII